MTSAFRVDLHSLSSSGGYSLGVVVRLEIALDNGHAELGGKIRKRPFEQGSLSRAGGTDEVQGKNAVPGETFLQTCRQFFVGYRVPVPLLWSALVLLHRKGTVPKNVSAERGKRFVRIENT